MDIHEGGCLCGAVRFEVTGAPLWVTVCHCRFCQKATGSAGMIQPVFPVGAFRLTAGAAWRYTHVSEGSGKEVHVHSCPDCATRLWLGFARWPDKLGLYAGAFDDPDWFDRTPETTKHIFTDAAPRGTILPAGFRTFPQHAATADGTPMKPVIFDAPHVVG